MVERGAFRFRLGQIGARELQALLDVPDHGVLHLVTMLREQRAVLQEEREGAPGLKDLAGVAEVGLAVFDHAAERFERRALRGHDRGDAPVDRQAAEVAAPRDTHAPEITMERLPESLAGFGDRLRRARVRSRDHAQQQRHVLHRAGHGALHAEPGPDRH